MLVRTRHTGPKHMDRRATDHNSGEIRKTERRAEQSAHLHARIISAPGDRPRRIRAPFAPRTWVETRTIQAGDFHRQDVVAGTDS